MLSSIWLYIKGLATNTFVALLSFFAGVAWQKQKQKIYIAEKRAESLKDAKDIHDRVDSDDGYRERVRDKYR